MRKKSLEILAFFCVIKSIIMNVPGTFKGANACRKLS